MGRLNTTSSNDVRKNSTSCFNSDLGQESFDSAMRAETTSSTLQIDSNMQDLFRLLGAKVTLRAPSIEKSSNLIEISTQDLEQSFEKLKHLPPAVTLFGSARTEPGDKYYEMMVDFARELAKAGFAVISGGGPGSMEAANKGAREGGGLSVGLNIILEKEQGINPYVDISHEFSHFFSRKVGMTKFSCAFGAGPGGFGTMDELFEILTLRQTEKIKDYPVVLLGKDYFDPLIKFVKEHLMAQKLISEDDLDGILVTDCPKEAAAFIKNTVIKKFGIEEFFEMKHAA